jgi:hypothetical protein
VNTLRVDFITDSSPYASLLVMPSIRLQNGNFQQRNHIVARLLVQGFVLALTLGFGWWGLVALGNHTLALETNSSLSAGRYPTDVIECPVPRSPAKGSAQEAGVTGVSKNGRGCLAKVWPHTTNLAQAGCWTCRESAPRRELEKDKSPLRISEITSSSKHFGE